MIIHKSHSKLELVKIIIELNIKIKNPRQYKKIDLSALLIDQLDTIDNINPNKILSVREKNDVIHKCKKIKHYCRNGCYIENTDYKNKDELLQDINCIKNHGSIPSVRKAIKEYNMNPIKDKIDIYIPPHILKEIEMKNKLKEKGKNLFKYHKGHFLLKFD